jgi:hypothetical protein
LLQRWTDFETNLRWASGPLELNGRVTVPTRADSIRRSTSGELGFALQLGSRSSFVASAGVTPSVGFIRGGSSRFATFGMRLTRAAMLHSPLPPVVRPAAYAFIVEPGPGEMQRIVIRVPGAHVVELTGDFTSWSPVALRETSPDRWEAIVRLLPGTHHVNVRVNGDSWTPPPGLPAVDDGFDGRVGLLIVH